MTLHDHEEQLRIVWHALDSHDDTRRDFAGHHLDADAERERDDICTAMAVIREAMGLPSETAPAIEPGPKSLPMDPAAIRAAVDAGDTVKCNGGSYQVIKDSIGQYLIQFLPERGNYIGLTGRPGTKYADVLNGSAFYIE